MKLYTEEQVRLLLDLAKLKLNGEMYSKDELLEKLTPIELPSDEEIKDKSFNKFAQSNARTCFEEGAKWIKEQILQPNL